MKWEIIEKATTFIAEEMGVLLKRASLSPNIRERMDHSCAIVDKQGRIVAQAEHIPVHLGSFKIAVKNVLPYVSSDTLIFNDPYISGTHLNDIGVITPVYYRGSLVAYVINKAHHVDVGGPAPGSINPNASTLYEEGVIIPPLPLGREVLEIIRENFKTPEVSIGDLNAQVSANKLAVKRLTELFDKYGVENVTDAWERSIEHTRSLLPKWDEGTYEAEDYLEWKGSLVNIRLRLTVSDYKIIADFSGTHPQVEGPINAVLGVTYSSVSFAIRSAINKEIPTNEGFYSFIEVKADEGLLVNPKKPAAVGGGNVETSQRIADVTFLALSKFLPVPAAGSGTMMNVMMGGVNKGRYWAYYETIGGGSGARPNSDGVSGVHVNMTNTMNTPIEVAESSYPILFTSYRVREGSGGKGKFRGGDGLVRGFIALDKLRLSILADRFVLGPWGLNGGERGKTGCVIIKRKSGKIEVMPSKFSTELEEGDEVIIETPGGGGYGRPQS
ncbi:hydantoinase B/oxoprolinase family protein [Stygiolobus caldivivus]|uniref:5-oxoprolinase n=1 Tax=Stygiolobus caldivivus TaxID=2824673 RepID=A0A8D5ZI69_9CREN|nr:hydantoinase B/oxoprolinase family protein [Stygiolobus caldivivus]BCU70349.1 5-oxoprolinase [Stygiolobus caldivivus]